MALGINTNVVSLNAQKNLAKSQDALGTSLQRLSSGLRINSAKDDAAGMSISDRMTAQIKGSTQAIRNANDGVSLSQTAEGALQQSTDILQRVRELSVQSSNGTNSASDRLSIQSEVNQLISQLDEIAQNTSFNGIKLLDGSFSAQQFQIGADAGQTLRVNIGAATTTSMGINSLTVNNTTAGSSVASNSNFVKMSTSVFTETASSGTLGGTFLTSASGGLRDQTITITNGTNPAQTLALKASTGSGAGMLDGDASVIAAKLNAFTGVDATATNSVSLTNLGLSDAQNGDQVNFELFVGDGTTSSKVNFIVNTTTQTNSEDNLDAAVTLAVADINTKAGNTDLSYDKTTNSIISASGRNIGITNFDKIDTAGGVITSAGIGAGDTFQGMTVTFGGVSIATESTADVSTVSNLVNALKSDAATVTGGTFVDNNNNTYTLTNSTTGEYLILTHDTASNSLAYQGYVGNTLTTGVSSNVTFAVGTATGVVSGEGLNVNANTGSSGSATRLDTATTGVTTSGLSTNASGSIIKFGVDTITDATTDAAAATNTAVAQTGLQMGAVSVFLDNGITIKSSLGDGATASGIFGGTAAAGLATTTAGGAGNIAQGNSVEAQTLTIQGTGTASVAISQNATVDNIVALVNKSSDATGVTAKGSTTATLSGLTTGGQVAFSLNGTAISATVNVADLTSLSTSINDATSKTGVIAALSPDKTSITLTNSTGADISVLDYTNSNSGTMKVTGVGSPVTLIQGKGDSTVVGGSIEFVSSVGNFQVSSNINENVGSLFASNASSLNGSTKTTINTIDVTTVAGAQAAISAVDGALATIDANRADLGAIQNRFTKTVANLTTTVENLSASRSRIRDTDFAAETAELTKNQIMQQAGTAMLAQANQLPQSVLSLLQ